MSRTLRLVLGVLLVGSLCTSGLRAWELESVDEMLYRLEDFGGRVLVLEWLDPTCPHSRRHAGEELSAEIGEESAIWAGVVVGPVDDEREASITAFQDEFGVTFPILLDKTGAVTDLYGVDAMPAVVMFDVDGNVVYKGAIDDDPLGGRPPKARWNLVSGALAALADDELPDPGLTKAHGCRVN